ncbi:hypothetical protein BH23GEM9_BH23GEM9_35930 [soil metagenome]
MPDRRPTHGTAACMRLLERFLLDLSELHTLVSGPVGPDGRTAAARDRAAVEKVASALWGIFSHHRAVVDGAGVRYDLGSWRSAGELIADLTNRRYPGIEQPIRYMDCYMGVLTSEERGPDSQQFYHWIFRRLREAGCDWLYSSAVAADTTPESIERRARVREATAAISRAYMDMAAEGVYAPLPVVVAAYQDVFGRLPDGWPHV